MSKNEEMKKVNDWFKTLTRKEKIAVIEPHFKTDVKGYFLGPVSLWKNTSDETKLKIYRGGKNAYPTGERYLPERIRNE